MTYLPQSIIEGLADFVKKANAPVRIETSRGSSYGINGDNAALISIAATDGDLTFEIITLSVPNVAKLDDSVIKPYYDEAVAVTQGKYILDTLPRMLIHQFRPAVNRVFHNLELSAGVEEANIAQARLYLGENPTPHDWLMKEVMHVATDGVESNVQKAYASLGYSVIKHIMKESAVMESYIVVDVRERDNKTRVYESREAVNVPGARVPRGKDVWIIQEDGTGKVLYVIAAFTSIYYGMPHLYDLTLDQEFAGVFVSCGEAKAAIPNDVQARKTSQGWDMIGPDSKLRATVKYRDMQVSL